MYLKQTYVCVLRRQSAPNLSWLLDDLMMLSGQGTLLKKQGSANCANMNGAQLLNNFLNLKLANDRNPKVLPTIENF